MLGVVAPVDHKYELPDDDVSVTLPPAHRVVVPVAVMVGVAGSGLTTMVVGSEAGLKHP